MRAKRMRASAMDSVLELVLWTELSLDADWPPGCLFSGLRTWTMIALSCEMRVYYVQLVVGGTIECTIKAHRWFRVVAWFVQIMMMEIDEVDEVKCDE